MIAGPATVCPAEKPSARKHCVSSAPTAPNHAWRTETGSGGARPVEPRARELRFGKLRRRPSLPVDALDVLPRLADGEHPLVDTMKCLHHLLDVGLVLELAPRQRHLELPDLIRVPSLDEELARALFDWSMEPREELIDLLRQLCEPGVHGRGVKPVGVGTLADAELGDDVGEQAAAR